MGDAAQGSGGVAQFTLDGEAVDLEAFITDNDFDSEWAEDLRSLKVGDSRVFGGGAAATFILKREV